MACKEYERGCYAVGEIDPCDWCLLQRATKANQDLDDRLSRLRFAKQEMQRERDAALAKLAEARALLERVEDASDPATRFAVIHEISTWLAANPSTEAKR